MKKFNLYSSLLIASMLLSTNISNAETSTENDLTVEAKAGELKVSAKDVDLGKLVIGETIPSKVTDDLVSVTNNTGLENGVNLMVRSNNYKSHKDNIMLSLKYGDKVKAITSNNAELETFYTEINEQNRNGEFQGDWGNFVTAGTYQNDLVWTVLPEVESFSSEFQRLQNNLRFTPPKTSYYFRHWQGSNMGPSRFKNWSSVIGLYEGLATSSKSGNGVNEIIISKGIDMSELKSVNLDSAHAISSSATVSSSSPFTLQFSSDSWDKLISKDVFYDLEYKNDKVNINTKGLLQKKVTNIDDVQKYWNNKEIEGNSKIPSKTLKFTGDYKDRSLEGYVPLQLKNGDVLNISVNIVMSS